MKSLLIVEPIAGGHRMHYVRHIVEGALKRGYRVIVATWPESIEHLSFKLIQEAFPGAFETVLLSKKRFTEELLARSTDFRQQFAFHQTFSDCYKSLLPNDRPSHVTVPFMNTIDKVVPLLGSPFGQTPWSGIVMRDTFHHSAMGIPGVRRKSDLVKRALFLRLARGRNLAKLFTIDAALPAYIAEHYPRLAGRVVHVPDPVSMAAPVEREWARNRLGISGDQCVVLVYGLIDERKRLDKLLGALSQAHCTNSVGVLIAGRQSSAVKELLKSAEVQRLFDAGRLHQLDEYLTPDSEVSAFAAADIVWVGYRQHFTMSGVLLQAGHMTLPVIACEEGLIGWITRQHQSGVVVDADDTKSIALTLTELCQDPGLRARLGAAGQRLAAEHTIERFAGELLDQIEEIPC